MGAKQSSGDSDSNEENGKTAKPRNILPKIKFTREKKYNPLLDILMDIQCDEYVASFINTQPEILEGRIEINDSNLFGYICLMQALKPPLKDAPDVNVTLDIQRDTSDVTQVLTLINDNAFNVYSFKASGDFRQPSTEPYSSESALKEMLKRCNVEEYTGPVTSNMPLPSTLSKLSVSVGNAQSFISLREFLRQKPSELTFLAVCVNRNLDTTVLQPLPELSFLFLFIPDVGKEDFPNVKGIIQGLKPTEESSQFTNIFFPRATFNLEDSAELLEQMAGVGVYNSVVLPSQLKPSTAQETEELGQKAKELLHCRWGVSWGTDCIDEW